MVRPPILVVDDAPVSLKLMRLLLTYEGYDVRTAERAEDALHMLTSYRPELVLADIQLPGMDGLEMTRKIKGNPRTSGIRVVALTACNVSGDKERAYRAGCEDYITKPIDTTTLASRVRELLARRPIERVEAPKPGPDVQPALSFSGPEMETLRRRFLSEGIERSQRLLATLDSGFDSAKAARQLHEWAGSAALIGCARISELSRKAESLLREESWESPCLREVLCDLLVTFAELSDSKAVPLPEYIVKAMTGKRVALVGLTQEHSDNMCAMLERVEARPRLFSVTDDPSCEAIQECDLVIVHVRPETLDSSWLRSAPPIAANRTFVLTGARRDLMALAPDVRMRAAEFLAGTGEPDEVLMRLAFALSRQTAPGSVRTAAANGISSSAAEVDAGPVVSRPQVLVADDDAIILMLVRSTLENHGMSCRSVDNGPEALRLIREEQPHVAVLDVNMPGQSGYEVLAAIRAENLPSRVILLTARQQEKDILQGFELGADDYLVKPFNPFELVARLRRLLRR